MDDGGLKLHFSWILVLSHIVMPERPGQLRSDPVPVFHLYGEDGQWLMPDLVHVESIAARSRLHNWEIKPHRHHGLFQLLWLRQGNARLYLDGEVGAIEGGAVLLVPQHCVHGFRFSRGARGLVVTIAYPLLVRLGIEAPPRTDGSGRSQLCRLDDLAAREPVEVLLAALEQEYAAQAEHRGLLLESMIGALLAWLLRAPEPQVEMPALARARQHLAAFSVEVERSYLLHLPLAHYADKLGISSAHLNAVCRQLTQRSALEIIHARLMLEARRSLAYSSMSIRDISESLGFGDPAYFTRFFRRLSGGLAPRDFRQRAMSMAAGH